MSDRQYAPRLDELPSLFDQLRFSNSEIEREARREFEHQLTKAVRSTDALLVQQANTITSELQDYERRAESIRRDLQEMEFALSEDEDIDLEEWSRLENGIKVLVAEVGRYEARMGALEERLSDPLAYASELQGRFPGLHRPYLLPT
jgi:hypothetical protein